ncbi:MAG: hypothetical protein JO025_15025 [Verrucomicrobia bacterium]|nr:hypothetical protein [Verrucomicrobiota bacterium]
MAGAGSSTQHPIGSGTVARVYGRLARGALGTYNFAGDLGKAALPGVTSLLLIVFSWHAALWVIAGLGLAVASFIAILLPNISRTSPSVRTDNGYGIDRSFDSSTRVCARMSARAC